MAWSEHSYEAGRIEGRAEGFKRGINTSWWFWIGIGWGVSMFAMAIASYSLGGFHPAWCGL